MKVLLILILVTACVWGFSQEVVSTAGETIKNLNYEISYTIGEPVIETITGGNNVLTQGMHQTKLIVTSISELLYAGVKVDVFPNPTLDFVSIRFDQLIDKLDYSIFDNAGKRIENSKISSNETTLDFTNYISGTYILKLQIDNKKVIQTFKIIKK